jgi:hypothetical protein
MFALVIVIVILLSIIVGIMSTISYVRPIVGGNGPQPGSGQNPLAYIALFGLLFFAGFLFFLWQGGGFNFGEKNPPSNLQHIRDEKYYPQHPNGVKDEEIDRHFENGLKQSELNEFSNPIEPIDSPHVRNTPNESTAHPSEANYRYVLQIRPAIDETDADEKVKLYHFPGYTVIKLYSPDETQYPFKVVVDGFNSRAEAVAFKAANRLKKGFVRKIE